MPTAPPFSNSTRVGLDSPTNALKKAAGGACGAAAATKIGVQKQ